MLAINIEMSWFAVDDDVYDLLVAFTLHMFYCRLVKTVHHPRTFFFRLLNLIVHHNR